MRSPSLAPRLLLGVLAFVGGGCASEPPRATLLDREYEAYRGDREERRYEDLKSRHAKARAEADRLDAEVRRLDAEVAAKKIRASAATAAALRLPEPLRVESVPAGPSSAPGAGR